MPLTLTSKTYPLAKNAIVTNLIPDGTNGFIGLTAIDAWTVIGDPANHFCVDTSVYAYLAQPPGQYTLLALAFSEDAGKTYQALPILIRTPSDDPAYPYGLSTNTATGGSNPYQASIFCYYFMMTANNYRTLLSYSLVRDPQSGAPVLIGINSNGSNAGYCRWTAQGDGKTAESWVTTRPLAIKRLPNVTYDTTSIYQFFPDVNKTLSLANGNVGLGTTGYFITAPYPKLDFGGSPGLAFGGAETVYYDKHPGTAQYGAVISPLTGTYVKNLVYNWPYVPVSAPQQAQLPLGTTGGPVAQHPHQPSHLISGNPDRSSMLAQSFDAGATASKLYISGQGSVALLPAGDLFPTNNSLFFVEDAIYSFGAWGFSVSRDGGGTWPGETIGGIAYSFNLLRAKGGGYFPDNAILDGKYAFTPIRDDTSSRTIIARNSPPAAANPGGRVNSSQKTSVNNDGGYGQLAYTQTAHFSGTFWHGVALNTADGTTRWILLVSHDLGATWEQLPEPPRISYGTQLVADTRTGWLHWGLQYISRDGGQSWIAS